MDCHVIATGCEVCKQQTAGAGDIKGEDLRAHLVSLTPVAHGEELG